MLRAETEAVTYEKEARISLRRFFCFWWQCARAAAKGSAAFANNWMWLVSVPIVTGISVGIATQRIQRHESALTTGNPAFDGLIAAFVAFIIAWIISFSLRLLSAPVMLFDQEKERAERAELKIKGSLKFAGEIRTEGGGGHYVAYATVRNTSLALKMTNCRCEITELRDASGEIIERNFGLRTKGQQEDELGGRFNLDQGSEKEIILFELDQLQDTALYIISAGPKKLKLDFGTYTARICGYGDSGQADEITIKVDSRATPFAFVS